MGAGWSPSRRGNVEALKRRIDYRLFYGQHVNGDLRRQKATVRCPLHDDEHPSLSVDLEQGLFYCQAPGCRAHNGGDVITFVMLLKGVDFSTALRELDRDFGPAGSDRVQADDDEARSIPDEVVRAYMSELVRVGGFQQSKYLLEVRGWTMVAWSHFEIGLDGDAFTIPIRDLDGVCRNIKRYRPRRPEGVPKFTSYASGYGTTRLFNLRELTKHDAIIVCEGETDVITSWQHGIPNCVSATNGAGSWDARWNELFSGKRVAIIYDIDQAGRDGAASV